MGNGAREHTLVWKLAQSPKVEGIFAAPGNAGTAELAYNLPINATDIESLAQATQEKGIDLVVVGPETPLAGGITDYLQQKSIPVFGPTMAAAALESSKVFAKELLQEYNIPCARSVSFTDYKQAEEYIYQQTMPVVIKADGLAAGKGVTVAETREQALGALDKIMKARAFGSAGNSVVVEEFLSGREMSAFAFTDGRNIIPMVAACDYKRAYDGNLGPNTGGMGSYSPPCFYSPALAKTVNEVIMRPAVRAMEHKNRIYKGVLYGGLMVTADGPKVLEFNARFGDPETQVILPLLKTDLLDVIMAVINGNLNQIDVTWSENACVGVVMASGGYPDRYKTGLPISGLDKVDEDVLVFHAGTRVGDEPGQILTSGGRVLTVVATGKTIKQARDRVYANLCHIQFEDCFYRKDIAQMVD